MVLKLLTNKGRLLCMLALLLISFGCARKIATVQVEPLPQPIKAISNLVPTIAIKDTIIDDVTKRDTAKITPSPIITDITETKEIKGRYARANRLYAAMIDSMAKVILEYPIQDSAGLPYATDWVGTPNMGLRRPNYVIIHHTATNNCNNVIQEFTTPGGREASAHYLICKDGTVYHLLNDLLRSHHAGDSKWGNTTDLNSSSIGIELDNNGYQPFTEEQMNSLTILLGRLKDAYKIPAANFIGHGDIAPARKMDPNWRFPWKELSEKGFGLWWGDTTNVKVDNNFDYLMALRIIGYDISAPASAVAAFKRHFMKDNSGGGMNAVVRKIIYAVYRKYQ